MPYALSNVPSLVLVLNVTLSAEICVVGGGEIYSAAMPLADRLYVTHIAARPDGDTLFPEISPAEWSVVSREALPQSDGDTVTGEHVVYAKRR